MLRSADPSDELAALIGELVTVNNRLTRLAATALDGAESPAIWRTLGVLRDLGPMRLGELARTTRVSQPTMTKLVHTLDERGWIRRIADADDARAWSISADPHGLAALEAWRTRISQELAPHFADLDADELATLEGALGILRARFDRADAEVRGTAARTGADRAGAVA